EQEGEFDSDEEMEGEEEMREKEKGIPVEGMLIYKLTGL
ncbi:hypothetical protein Tco_1323219, partial [Tanacetum coccineum]